MKRARYPLALRFRGKFTIFFLRCYYFWRGCVIWHYLLFVRTLCILKLSRLDPSKLIKSEKIRQMFHMEFYCNRDKHEKRTGERGRWRRVIVTMLKSLFFMWNVFVLHLFKLRNKCEDDIFHFICIMRKRIKCINTKIFFAKKMRKRQ